MPQRAVEIDDRETIVVGGTIAALVLAAIYWVSRVGFESQTVDVLRSLGLSLFILAAPYWVWRALRRRDSDFVWSRSQPLLTLATIAFTAVVALVTGRFAGAVGVACSVLGALSAALVLFSWIRNGAFRSRLAFTVGTVVFSAWAAGVMWTSRYKMPLYWEVFANSANVHHDTLYLVSIGNTLRTYGVPSTGLDGIPYAWYHYGSPWLFSRWADLVQTDLLSFYSLGYALILAPLFLASIAMLATGARKSSRLARPQGWLRSNWWGWLALAVATIGIIPDSALAAMAVWNAHVLISESYLAGLPVFMMVMTTAIIAWRGERFSPGFLFVFLPLALTSLGFLKVSLMVLLLALIVYAVLRLKAWTSISVAASLLVMLAACYLTYKAVALPTQNGGFYPFHFMRSSTPDGWHQFFPLIHFAWTWIYVAGRLYEERITDMGAIASAVRSRRMLDVELLLVLAVLGFLPGEVFSIHGGSAIYFSDVQRWVALALVIARAGHWVVLWRARRGAESASIAAQKGRGGSLRLATVLAVFVAAPFVVTMLLNTVRPPLRLLRQNLALRSALVTQAGVEARLAAGDRRLLFDPAVLRNGLAKSDYYPLIQSLRSIERIPTASKSDMVVFIPQSYQLFWRIFDSDDRCTYVGLIVPAITEMALIDGMPYYGCKVTDQYNMQAYQPRLTEQTPQDVTDAGLCGKAAAKGFHGVMVLEPDARGMPRRRTIDCREGSGGPPA